MITFLKKIDFDKINKRQMTIFLLVGVLLVVISIPTNKEAVEQDQEEEQVATISSPDYKEDMEQQLEEILLEVEGVGDVKVMITLASSTELIVEKDKEIRGDEQIEATIFSDSEQGKTPYVKQEYYPMVEGVLVIATGGGNSVVIENVTEAIQALFEVDTHKIKIMKMK